MNITAKLVSTSTYSNGRNKYSAPIYQRHHLHVDVTDGGWHILNTAFPMPTYPSLPDGLGRAFDGDILDAAAIAAFNAEQDLLRAPYDAEVEAVERACAAINREIVKIYRQAITAALADLGLNSNQKVRWNPKAGCRCGCSPAFVLETSGNDFFWMTIAITTDDAALQAAADAEAVRLAKQREVYAAAAAVKAAEKAREEVAAAEARLLAAQERVRDALAAVAV